MHQEKLLHIVSRFYIRNKENRRVLKKVRTITGRIRSLRIPLYKNIFDVIHFRSYFIVLERLVKLYKPRVVFEWGPGLNTELFARHGAKVYTVEHMKRWYDLYVKKGNTSVTYIHSELRDDSFLEYPHEILKVKEHVDMAFVDARCRVQCIESCKEKGVPIVVMHDSLHYLTMQPAPDGAPPVFNNERLCKDGFSSYTYFVEIVDLRTIVLCDDPTHFSAIENLFSDFYIEAGKTEEYDRVIRKV
jgi:hypothetical protein